MAQCTKVSGKMIYNMEKALRLGLIKVDTKVTMHTEESMVLVVTNGMMAVSTLVIGERTKLVV
jgi:hypothetical protein